MFSARSDSDFCTHGLYLLSTVQIHHITSLQVLRHLRLPHILLYIHSAGPRLAQVSLRQSYRVYANSSCDSRADVKKPFDASCLINGHRAEMKEAGEQEAEC